MIINYSTTEIEHTLYLFPFAKVKIAELERELNKDIKSSLEYNHYLFIVKVSEFWLSKCEIDEGEIIRMRFFEKRSFDYISIQLGYKNHSSIIRKTNEILKRLSKISY